MCEMIVMLEVFTAEQKILGARFKHWYNKPRVCRFIFTSLAMHYIGFSEQTQSETCMLFLLSLTHCDKWMRQEKLHSSLWLEELGFTQSLLKHGWVVIPQLFSAQYARVKILGLHSRISILNKTLSSNAPFINKSKLLCHKREIKVFNPTTAVTQWSLWL